MSETYGSTAYPKGQLQRSEPEAQPTEPGQNQPAPPAPDPNEVTEPTGEPVVPEKFRKEDGSVDSDALLKSYLELEKRQSAPSPQPDAPEPPPPAGDQPLATDAETVLDEVVTRYADTFQKTGALPEEAYAEIQQRTGGAVTKRWVDRYFEGEVALADRQARQLMETVGGEAPYRQMMDWAAKSLPDRERSALDAQLQAALVGGPDQVAFVLTNLKTRWESATKNPNLVFSDGPASSSVQPFRSHQEMQDFIRTPGYQRNDPAAHREFNARLKAAKERGYF